MARTGYMRPAPEGFAEVASTLSLKELAIKFKAGQVVIQRSRKEIGWKPVSDVMAIPPDGFAAMARKSTTEALKRHYGVGDRRIKSWCLVLGIEPGGRNACRRPIPDDFAVVAPTLVKTRLTSHYNADIKTVTRWLEVSGLRAAEPVQQYHPRKGGMVFQGHAQARMHRDTRPSSIHDDAADVLRKYAACFRCDERGRADLNGNMWRLGNIIVSPDELLDRAEAKRRRAA